MENILLNIFLVQIDFWTFLKLQILVNNFFREIYLFDFTNFLIFLPHCELVGEQVPETWVSSGTVEKSVEGKLKKVFVHFLPNWMIFQNGACRRHCETLV